jgi:hypothetical protein
MSHNLVHKHHCFEETCCLHLQSKVLCTAHTPEDYHLNIRRDHTVVIWPVTRHMLYHEKCTNECLRAGDNSWACVQILCRPDVQQIYRTFQALAALPPSSEWLSLYWQTFIIFSASLPYFDKKQKEAYEIILLSACVSLLIFVRRLMRSPCCPSVCHPNLFIFYAVCATSKQKQAINSSRTSC